MRINKILSLLFVALMAVSIYSCEKDNKITAPAPMAEFPAAAGTYLITSDPNTQFKIPVGISNPSSSERKVNFTVTSPTGAVAGTHYTLVQNGSITIPAGTSLDSITVKGIFANYPVGRKDTLTFTVTGGDPGIGVFPGASVYKLVMQKSCPVTLSALVGNYNNTTELFGTQTYGPYQTTISAFTNLTATTGTITVTNIYDYGWNPIIFNVDWSDASNVKITTPTQTGIGDAGTLSAAYAGQDVTVRAFTGQTGSLNMCDQKLVLKMQVGITGVGFYTDLYTVNLAR